MLSTAGTYSTRSARCAWRSLGREPSAAGSMPPLVCRRRFRMSASTTSTCCGRSSPRTAAAKSSVRRSLARPSSAAMRASPRWCGAARKSGPPSGARLDRLLSPRSINMRVVLVVAHPRCCPCCCRPHGRRTAAAVAAAAAPPPGVGGRKPTATEDDDDDDADDAAAAETDAVVVAAAAIDAHAVIMSHHGRRRPVVDARAGCGAGAAISCRCCVGVCLRVLAAADIEG